MRIERRLRRVHEANRLIEMIGRHFVGEMKARERRCDANNAEEDARRRVRHIVVLLGLLAHINVFLDEAIHKTNVDFRLFRFAQ